MTKAGMFSLIFTSVWCLVGVSFLAVGFGLRRSFLRREERLRARAEGTVTEVVRRVTHSSSGANVAFHPIVDFDADGRHVSLECTDGGGRKTFFEGQTVGVLYDPDDPACFRLEGRETLNLLGKVFLGVGLGCVAIGLIVGLGVNLWSKGLPTN